MSFWQIIYLLIGCVIAFGPLFFILEAAKPINYWEPMDPDTEREWLRTFNLTEAEIDELMDL